MRTFRDVVVPVVSAYALLAGVVVYAVRHPEIGLKSSRPAGWTARLRLIALTVGGGYLCFLAIVLIFHVWVVGQRGAMRSAARGGTFLAVFCAASFILASVLEAKLRMRKRDRPGALGE